MDFYIIYNGRQVGPLPVDQLENYGLSDNSMVWSQGMPDWAPAHTVPELHHILQKGRTTPPPFNSQYPPYPPRSDFFDSLSSTGTSGKSRLAFALFAIFLGCLGVQYFYVNKINAGVITIILSAVTCGLWAIVPFIQGVLVLVMSQEEFERKFVYNPATFPIF